MPPPNSLFNISRFVPFVNSRKDVIFIGLSKNGKVMGRPTENPKTHIARLRLSDSEKKKLDECCRLTCLSITEVLKLGIDKVYQEAITK